MKNVISEITSGLLEFVSFRQWIQPNIVYVILGLAEYSSTECKAACCSHEHHGRP